MIATTRAGVEVYWRVPFLSRSSVEVPKVDSQMLTSRTRRSVGVGMAVGVGCILVSWAICSIVTGSSALETGTGMLEAFSILWGELLEGYGD